MNNPGHHPSDFKPLQSDSNQSNMAKVKKTNKEATGHNRVPRNKLLGKNEKNEAKGQVLSF